MKKIFLILLSTLLLCGCESIPEESSIKKEDVPSVKKEEVYQDLNNTPIAFYQVNGSTLEKITTITKKLNVEEDIGVFQIYPSNEDSIVLDKGFGYSFYEKWMEYKQVAPIKIGFNMKFHLRTGEDVSYNMLTPADTFNRWEHFMNYFYDDYANREKSFYSHIENDEYTEDTLFTSLKIQSSYQILEVDSKILVTVFTYDGEDDFDDDGEYRGNSSYTFTICIPGIEC